jgi:hypothetical protein
MSTSFIFSSRWLILLYFSGLWELFSFIYQSTSKSVLHTIDFVSNIPMFAFRTSILYLTNIRFISYGYPFDFFPNIRWRTEMLILNIHSLSYEHPMFGMTTAKRLEVNIYNDIWSFSSKIRNHSNKNYNC